MAASVKDLVKILTEASDAYYNGDKPLMDDATYDGLMERLKEMDPENPYFDEVGAAPAQGAVALPFPMPSLDKIKPGEDTLKRFLTNRGFVLSEKLDGISALWYKDRLYLRGNGLVGQDVTHLVALGIQGLAPSPVAVRGELILPRSEGEPLARNWVNGQIHQKTPDPVKIRKIHFLAYEIMGKMKRSDQFDWLQVHGFEVPWVAAFPVITETALATILQDRRVESPYDTDGIVIALDTVPKSESTKTKAKNPKDSVAFKMPLAEQSAETTVQEVIWAASGQGYLIPRIRFTPVTIGSAKIEFCTGHNARMILLNKIGPGAKIVIRRSGDVIPKIDRVLVPTKPSFPPEGTWEWDGPAETAVHIKAVGVTEAMTSAKLYYFLKTLDIPGAGPAAAASLVEAGITGPAALWAAPVAALSKILGPKTGANLHANLRKAFDGITELKLMVASLTMPRGIGDTKLSSLFGTEPDPRRWDSVAPPSGWSAASFTGFLKEFPVYLAWRAKEVPWIAYPILAGKAEVAKAEAPAAKTETLAAAAAAPAPAAVKPEVISMSGFRDKALEEAATRRGHTVIPNFTGRVTVLVIPDGPMKNSEKVKVALARDIPILSRSDFVKQYLA
jgi:DNA ligase (NAD+)